MTRSDLLGLHAAALLLGGTSLFAKLINLPALDITALRGLMASALLVCLISLTRGRFRLSSMAQYRAMLLGGLLFALHWMTYFYSMQVSSVAVGVIALFTFPVITALMEPLLDRQPPTLISLLMAVLVLCGVILISLENQLEGQVGLGLSVGILSAFLYSARNILQRRRLEGVAGTTLMTYQAGITALVFLPFLGSGVGEISSQDWWLLLLLASVFTALPHSLVAHGQRRISATNTAFILSLQVLYATLFAALILSEIPGLATLAGGLCIVCASLITSISLARGGGQRTEDRGQRTEDRG